MNHDYDQSGTEGEQDRWERAILDNLDWIQDAEAVALAFDTTWEVVQRICGARGHDWEDCDNESILCPVTWRACALCGANDDNDGEP